MLIFFDIETIPSGDLPTDEEMSPPKNYKDHDKIKTWIEEKKEEVFRKRALSFTEAQVVCISYSFGEGLYSSYGDDEEQVIKSFWKHVKEKVKTVDLYTLDWIGYNIARFDLPILFLRACKYNIADLRFFFPKSPRIIDLMKIATYNVYGEFLSMDKLCKFLGIEGKGDMDGSKVYDTWLVDKDKIRRYCEQDVRTTMELYRKMK